MDRTMHFWQGCRAIHFPSKLTCNPVYADKTASPTFHSSGIASYWWSLHSSIRKIPPIGYDGREKHENKDVDDSSWLGGDPFTEWYTRPNLCSCRTLLTQAVISSQKMSITSHTQCMSRAGLFSSNSSPH